MAGHYNVFTFTREMAEKLVGEDVRPFAGSADTLKNLIDRITNTPLGTINLELLNTARTET